MSYLTKAKEIRTIINQLISYPVLWLDTEVADSKTPNPRLSLIQVLAAPDKVYVFDVLNQSDLVQHFINQIMVNGNIEKIFHNAPFDLRYLGKERAENVTCTLKLARKISLDILDVPNRKLKTLAAKLGFENVDTESQSSDWGRRPLSKKQLQYSKMDVVYLAAVHRHLLELTMQPTTKSNNTSFNGTDVRIAFECPRLFYLGHLFGGKTLFIPENHPRGIGNNFHKIGSDFLKTAGREPRFLPLFAPQTLEPEALGQQMESLLYELVFYPYLQKADPATAPALYQVWQGLTGLIARWAQLLAQNRPYSTPEKLISKTFIAQEDKLQHQFTLPNGNLQPVGGTLDSLMQDLERKRLRVIEYKTYTPVDPSAQLAQVALYSYMVREKLKTPVDSAVYCVLPEFKEYNYTWEELEDTVHELIPHKLQQMNQWVRWKPGDPKPPPSTTQPHLCHICPQQEKCQSFFSSVNPIVEKENTHSTPDAERMAEQLISALKSFKIGVDYLGAAVGSAFIRVKLKPHPGVKVVSLVHRAEDLQVQLGIVSPPLIAPQPGYVSVDLPRPDRQIANFDDYIKGENTAQEKTVKIAIGIDLDGKLVEADLADANTCHFLIGGTTGSGKSEFLRSLLLSLIRRHSPQQLGIVLVDPKRVTFPEFEGMGWLRTPIIKDSDRAMELMEKLVREVAKRYLLFEGAKCSHLEAYNHKRTQQQQPPLRRIVCIFDEYADFMAEKEVRAVLEQSIKRLGAMARAAGIHLIIATQRPDAKVVTPLIRSNLPGRIALRTASVADSKIILGGNQEEAAYLLGKGDLFYQVGSQLQRLQSLFASSIQITS